jgi:hypothetical protein
MAWQRTWRYLVVGGVIIVGGTLHPDGAAGQIIKVVQPSPPTYAIPLRDGGAAIVWWDAVSDPAHPGWRCEVPGQRGGGAGRTIITLAAAAGDWRAALEEAKALLKGRVTEGE